MILYTRPKKKNDKKKPKCYYLPTYVRLPRNPKERAFIIHKGFCIIVLLTSYYLV